MRDEEEKRRRNEKRYARRIQRETGVKYMQALRQVREQNMASNETPTIKEP